MYLVAIHVPIYLDGSTPYVATDWLRSLRLLRDSFGGHYGHLAVIAPTRPCSHDDSGQMLEQLDSQQEGIELITSFDNRCRSREYWLRHRKQWCAQLNEAVSRATIVHAGLDDLYRPISYQGFVEARRQGRVTVFVQDTDIATQTIQLNAGRGAASRTRAYTYARLYSRLCRKAVATASLAMLKGSSLMQRYAHGSCNAKLFHDTSFGIGDIIAPDMLERRCAETRERLLEGGALRLVYCGRLTQRKGVTDSIAIIANAIKRGANIVFDVIGDGEQKEELQQLVASLEVGEQIRFLGSVRYGAPLFDQIRKYDALMFTPEAEDTPRMIFDGYAAGLPLIAYDIDYVRERAREESTVLVLPFRNIESSTQKIMDLIQSPNRLFALSQMARQAAIYHAAESWYERRAEWTIEASQKATRGQVGSMKQFCVSDSC